MEKKKNCSIFFLENIVLLHVYKISEGNELNAGTYLRELEVLFMNVQTYSSDNEREHANSYRNANETDIYKLLQGRKNVSSTAIFYPVILRVCLFPVDLVRILWGKLCIEIN